MFFSPEDLPSYGLWCNILGTGNFMSALLDSTVVDLSRNKISTFSGSGCSNLSCFETDCIDTRDWKSAVKTSSFTHFSAFLQGANLLSLTAGEWGRSVQKWAVLCSDQLRTLLHSTQEGQVAVLPLNIRAPGVWCIVVSDGGTIVASTSSGADFDSQTSVFPGSCG
jgi:hypothetical protein